MAVVGVGQTEISITHVASAEAVQEEISAGTADISLDDLPASGSPSLDVPSGQIAVLRLDPSNWPLSDENVRRALSTLAALRSVVERPVLLRIGDFPN